MNNYRFLLKSTAIALAMGLATAGSALADFPGRHPGYLHALSDLRAARWMLEHRLGDATVSGDEDMAIQQIDAAISDLKQAAIDDGKNIHDHPEIQLPHDYPGRLHNALELLKNAHGDVDKEEDDPEAEGLKYRSLEHMDKAIHATEQAIHHIESQE